MKVLPILFNTDMVRALLEGRKSVTRRVIRSDMEFLILSDYPIFKSPYEPGDILYVRETWSPVFVHPKRFLYKADVNAGIGEGVSLPIKWHPSIHMPKEAARIFLRVKDVRAERLRDITEDQARAEGAGDPYDYQRSMVVNGRNIRGFICPDYAGVAEILSLKEDENMTGEEILEKIPMDKLLAKIQAFLIAQPMPAWVGAQGEYAEAVAMGITDGSEPTRLTTRYETAIMNLRTLKKARGE